MAKKPHKTVRLKKGDGKPAGKQSLVKTKINLKKKALLEALEQSLGIVTTACKKVGVGRSQFYEYMRTDPEFKAAYEDIENVALDFGESKLLQRMGENSDACIIFYLKTKGKNRGYVERTEFTGQNGNSIAIQVVTTDPEIEQMIKEM